MHNVWSVAGAARVWYRKRRMIAVLRSAREIVQYRTLLANLVARDLKVRYKRSVLGVLWTMLNPLLMMIVFSIVFANIFRFTFEHFVIYFLSAYVLWNFVAQTTSWSTACLIGYAPLIRKIYVPKAVFVLATVLSGLVNLLVSLDPAPGDHAGGRRIRSVRAWRSCRCRS